MIPLEVAMPKYEPIPLVTKGMSWWQRVKATYITPRQHALTENYLVYYKPWRCWLVMPKKFPFDGASIPRWLWWLIPPMGIFLVPSLPHDLGYRYGELICLYDNGNVVYCKIHKEDVDKVFHTLSDSINQMPISSWVAWQAVVWMGFAWGAHRRNNNSLENDYPQDVMEETLQPIIKQLIKEGCIG